MHSHKPEWRQHMDITMALSRKKHGTPRCAKAEEIHYSTYNANCARVTASLLRLHQSGAITYEGEEEGYRIAK